MILVVDDNRSAAQALAKILNRQGHRAQAYFDGPSACERLAEGDVEWVFSDLKMEPMDGLELLRFARGLEQPPQVVLMTGFGSVDIAVTAMQEGARDFLTKPVSPSTVLELLQPSEQAEYAQPVLLGEAPATQAIRTQVKALAGVDSTVLVIGEPGSGRAALARGLHREGRMVTLTHPEHVPKDLSGVATLLLPSVDLLSPAAQQRLNQLLDALPPSGGPRILASAGEDWPQKAARDPATKQLYYRLAVLVLRVPPLRERMQDLPTLLATLAQARAEQLGRSTPVASQSELQDLAQHDWPGNLRELQAVVERAVVFGNFQPPADAPGSQSIVFSEGFSLAQHLEDTERTVLLQGIEQAEGDRQLLGDLLGVERNTLRYKLKKFGLLDRVS
ncbi:MAG: DNA-binding NtrC family response regulator [Cognaticolwellia sp.]